MATNKFLDSNSRQDYENLDSAQYYIETQQSSKSAPAPMNSQFNSAVKQSGIMRDACVNTVVTLSQSYGGEKSKEFIDINHVDSKIKTGALNLSSSKHTPTTNVSKQFRKIKKKNENGTKIIQVSENKRFTAETKQTLSWAKIASLRKPPTKTRAE